MATKTGLNEVLREIRRYDFIGNVALWPDIL